MGIYVNPNNANFEEALNSPIFVDKSMAIAQVNKLVKTTGKYACVSRARRFGKTMVGNMLAAYYSKGCDSRALFENLKIAKDLSFEKYLNKLNVIQLDLNALYSSHRDEDIIALAEREVARELRQQFPQAGIESDNMDFAIKRVYESTGEQFVIIIDEYDVLVREKTPRDYFEHFLSFLNGMFKNVNLAPAIALAYITGILPIVRDRVQSKLNMFREYTMLDAGALAGCIGFTDDEVRALCEEHNMDFEECKRWYDGYRLKDVEVYNSNSVVKAMQNGEFENYWNKTGSFEAVSNFIQLNFEGTLDDVKTMIGGGRVDVNTLSFLNTMTDFRCKDDVFTYLIHLGYLAYDRKEKQCYIPNREVRDEWVSAIRFDANYKSLFNMINASKQLVESTIEGDGETVAAALDAAHSEICNNLSYNNEYAFQSAIGLAYFYANLKYTVVREMPTGKGVADIAFIPYVPNTPALIVELKCNQCAQTALDQIKAKNYRQCLSQYTGDLLFVGVNYDRETKKHECRIEKFVKEF